MRTLIAGLLIVALLGSGLTASAGHLVDKATIDAALSESARQAAADRARLAAALSGPEAERTARELGWNAARARASVASLSDAEVRDLAARAAVLQSDPVAGAGEGDLLKLLLIILIVILVLKAL